MHVEFAHQRRYGLVGKNGVGKTTLLKAIAAFEVENMPLHHRILHVRQEIRAAGGDISVLQAVMSADIERNTGEFQILITSEYFVKGTVLEHAHEPTYGNEW